MGYRCELGRSLCCVTALLFACVARRPDSSPGILSVGNFARRQRILSLIGATTRGGECTHSFTGATVGGVGGVVARDEPPETDRPYVVAFVDTAVYVSTRLRRPCVGSHTKCFVTTTGSDADEAACVGAMVGFKYA